MSETPIISPEFQVGQNWSCIGRHFEPNATLTILKVEGTGDNCIITVSVQNLDVIYSTEEVEGAKCVTPLRLSYSALKASVESQLSDSKPKTFHATETFAPKQMGNPETNSVTDALTSIEAQAGIQDNPFGNWFDRVQPGEQGFENELLAEISPGHRLHGVGIVRTVARAFGSDDALFELETPNSLEDARYAEVHLTWRHNENPPHPITQIYQDLSEWYAQFNDPRDGDSREKEPPARRYQVGQVWTYHTRQGEEDSRLVVVRITEDAGHKAYSVVLKNVRLVVNNETGEIQDELPHAPMSRDALDRSVIELIDTKSELPDFEWAWQEWRDAKGGVYTISASKILTKLEEAASIANNPFPSVNWSRIEDGQELEDQLRKELRTGDLLQGVPVRAVARSGDNVLFQILQSEGLADAQYAQVHMMWNTDWDIPNEEDHVQGVSQRSPIEYFADIPAWYQTVHKRLHVQTTQSNRRSNSNTITSDKIAGLTKTTWWLLTILTTILTLAFIFATTN